MGQVAITVIVAFVTGAAGSLVAPWAQWSVENRRDQRLHDRALIRSWREGLAAYEALDEDLFVTKKAFVSTPWYGDLRRHLHEPEDIENCMTGLKGHTSGQRSPQAVALRAEIDRIEADWF